MRSPRTGPTLASAEWLRQHPGLCRLLNQGVAVREILSAVALLRSGKHPRAMMGSSSPTCSGRWPASVRIGRRRGVLCGAAPAVLRPASRGPGPIPRTPFRHGPARRLAQWSEPRTPLGYSAAVPALLHPEGTTTPGHARERAHPPGHCGAPSRTPAQSQSPTASDCHPLTALVWQRSPAPRRETALGRRPYS